MDLFRLAYYPFLPDVRDAVRELGPDVPTLLTSSLYDAVRRRGVQRVKGALDKGFRPAMVTDERSALHELLSVPIARMLVVLANERFIVAKYAAAESSMLAKHLADDEDPQAILRVADALGVRVDGEGDAWSMSVPDYLVTMPHRKSEWKLVLQRVEQGRVTLDRKAVIGLCAETLRRRIETELEAEAKRPMPGDLKAALQPLLERMAPELEAARERANEGAFGPVRAELFPPCMSELFSQMAQGVMVPHHGRFAVASFLGTIGLDATGIMEFFKQIPNFDPEKSRYQIEHIAGERSVESYTPPGCDWMQTNGVCPLAKRDGLCFKIKHPLSYYRARIRFAKQDEEKAEKILAEARAKAGGGDAEDANAESKSPGEASREATPADKHSAPAAAEPPTGGSP